MPRTRFAVAAAAGALLGLAACDGPVNSPEAASPTASASPAARAGSAAPPPLLAVRPSSVDRLTVPEFTLHLDVERGLLAVHAPVSDLEDLCAGGSAGLDFGLLEARAITTPSEIEQFLFHAKGSDLPVAVYRADSFEEAGFESSFGLAGSTDLVDFGALCAFLTGPDLVARGTVRRVSNLSNASFAASWTGTLERAAGGQTRLTEVYQLTADAQEPGDTSRWSLNASKVLLH